MSQEDMGLVENKMRHIYLSILGQLVEMRSETRVRAQPLRDLFVFLSWPLALDEGKEQDRADIEKEFERLVMGARYDAIARGEVWDESMGRVNEHGMGLTTMPSPSSIWNLGRYSHDARFTLVQLIEELIRSLDH
jgi:hypothetical protein